MTTKKLWTWLAAVIIGSFAVLIFYGVDIYRKIPPVPDKVVTTDGTIVATGTPEKIAKNKKSYTGLYLKKYLNSSHK